MPQYRRAYPPGGIVFLTWVTFNRTPHFAEPENIARRSRAIAVVRTEAPFEIIGAVILPEHIHFLWRLPPDDSNYSKRVGRIKVLFTKALRGNQSIPDNLSRSRRKHRERDVWQRRFWEHTLREPAEIATYMDYIHFNPVKHGYVLCPHLWPYSSFHQWVNRGDYTVDWGCQCEGRRSQIPDFSDIIDYVGE